MVWCVSDANARSPLWHCGAEIGCQLKQRQGHMVQRSLRCLAAGLQADLVATEAIPAEDITSGGASACAALLLMVGLH